MKLQKTYLSREIARLHDMPVGDPFGGPAYGEKRGPAVALVGAAMSIEVGLSIGLNSLVGGLMVAGGVMSGLGALTGNKTLSQLGMVAGLAGGVAGMMDIGGAFEAAGTNFSEVAGKAFTDDKGLSGLFGGGSGQSVTQVIGDGQSFAGAAQSQMPGKVADLGQLAGAGATEAAIPQTGSLAADAAASGMNNTGVTAAGMNNTGVSGSSGLYDTSLSLSKVGGGAGQSKSLFGGLIDGFNKQDPMTKYGMMNAGSEFMKSIASAPSEEEQAQQDALVQAKISELQSSGKLTEAKVLSEQYALERAKTRAANMNNNDFANFIPSVNQTRGLIMTPNANQTYQKA